MAPEPRGASPDETPVSSGEEARRARAARLHAQIDRARSTAPPAADDEESPRDRIARRMRELDQPGDNRPDDEIKVDEEG
jgi:hypothetical protein